MSAIIKEGIKAGKKIAKAYKGRKRGRKTKAQREAKAEAARKRRAAAGPQHRGQKAVKAEAATGPRRSLSEKLKLDMKKVDLSGLSKEQKSERSKLITVIKKEIGSRGQGVVGGTRTRKLTPAGEKLANQGKFQTLLKNPKRYMYEGQDAKLTPKDFMAEYPTKKARREAFEEMSRSEKIEFLTRTQGSKLTPTQINELVGQGRSKFKLPQENIASIVRKAERQGYPTSFAELKKRLKKTRKGQTKATSPVKIGTTTAPSRKKKGGKVGSKRKGCGVALRGYGKAMK